MSITSSQLVFTKKKIKLTFNVKNFISCITSDRPISLPNTHTNIESSPAFVPAIEKNRRFARTESNVAYKTVQRAWPLIRHTSKHVQVNNSLPERPPTNTTSVPRNTRKATKKKNLLSALVINAFLAISFSTERICGLATVFVFVLRPHVSYGGLYGYIGHYAYSS